MLLSDESQGLEHQQGMRWIYFLHFLTSIPFFLHGYFPTMLLLLASDMDVGSESISQRLFDNATHHGISLWPYFCGSIVAICSIGTLLDDYGRHTTLLYSSLLFILPMAYITFVPQFSFADGSMDVPSLNMTQGSAFSDELEKLYEGLMYSVTHISYGDIFSQLCFGFFTYAMLLSSATYLVEIAKSHSRGPLMASNVSAIILGFTMAIVIMQFTFRSHVDPAGLGRLHPSTTNFVTHRMKPLFRYYYLLPLILVTLLSIGLTPFPESPYWLMAHRTPADCIASLRQLRQHNAVGQEYGSLYESASREARHDITWKSLFYENSFRYIVLLGLLLQFSFFLSGMQYLMSNGRLVMSLCGMYDETVPNITDVCPKSVVMNEYFVYGFYPSEHDNSSTRRLTHYLHHTESAIEHDYRSTFDSLKYLGKYIVASTTLSGTAMFAALFASICGTLAGKRYLRLKGSRRSLLMRGYGAMAFALVMLAWILSDDKALKLLNYNSISSVHDYVDIVDAAAGSGNYTYRMLRVSDNEVAATLSYDGSRYSGDPASFSPLRMQPLAAHEELFAYSPVEQQDNGLGDNEHQQPTLEPPVSKKPTLSPVFRPSKKPTLLPTRRPTTATPSTAFPTRDPTREPTHAPSYRPTWVPSAKPSRHPTMSPTPRPTPPLSPLPYFYLEPQSSLSTINKTRFTFGLFILLFIFSYWASVGILSWLVVVESFPTRMRAKATAFIFGVSAMVVPVGYALACKSPPYYIIHNAVKFIYKSIVLFQNGYSNVGSAVYSVSLGRNIYLSANFANSSNATIDVEFNITNSTNFSNATGGSINTPLILPSHMCFDEWVGQPVALQLPVILGMFAVCLLIVAAFFFLAIPETDGFLLTEMDEVFDINDFDVIFGCCPHGRGAGYLGLRFSRNASAAYKHDEETSPLIQYDRNSQFKAISRVSSGSDQVAGSFSVLPSSAFDSKYDQDSSQESGGTAGQKFRRSLSKIKKLFSRSSPIQIKPETVSRDELGSSKARIGDPIRELSGGGLLWGKDGDHHTGSAFSSRAPSPTTAGNSSHYGSYGALQSNSSSFADFSGLSERNIGGQNQRKSSGSLNGISMQRSSNAGVVSRNNSRSRNKKYSLIAANFQFDEEEAGSDFY